MPSIWQTYNLSHLDRSGPSVPIAHVLQLLIEKGALKLESTGTISVRKASCANYPVVPLQTNR